MTDKDTPQTPVPSGIEERGGYQGTDDPGQPTNLMQPQVHPASQANGQAGGNAASTGATNQGGSAGGAGQDSGSN